MMAHCECATLHMDFRCVLRDCRECGTACCPSCAVEIESHAYCRWCAMAPTSAVAA
jgi:hypothetical protein